MKIAVQLYAQLRDAAGESALEIELPAGAAVNAALAVVYQKHPALERWDGCLLTALGVEYVPRAHSLREGEVLLLFPPVQGG